MSAAIPRGIRNNNPGNIRISTIQWEGKIKINTDGVFEQFDSATHGIAALVNNLMSYQLVHGLDTIAKIIDRWAPAMENDTKAYILAVLADAGLAGVTPTSPIDIRNPTILFALTMAIIKHENGVNPYASSDVMKIVIDTIKTRTGTSAVIIKKKSPETLTDVPNSDIPKLTTEFNLEGGNVVAVKQPNGLYTLKVTYE